ncbi:hypothetical protein BDN70DRAFT_879034 [Pholiota conissans]|uniref:Uncharacterized protein n=1 Tax=Pholiota conissans TaxID=109636 RepID=A0A9P5Z1L4_9AGAR|nr:hypothetical protein BDN70DRAFT_879034 [Pholiota conissans]
MHYTKTRRETQTLIDDIWFLSLVFALTLATTSFFHALVGLSDAPSWNARHRASSARASI